MSDDGSHHSRYGSDCLEEYGAIEDFVLSYFSAIPSRGLSLRIIRVEVRLDIKILLLL